MKRFAAVFAAVLAIASVLSASFLSSADFNGEDVVNELKNDHYYMLNLDTNSAVFSKGEADHVQPGAMNKVLAAVYACEKWGALDESIQISDDDLSIAPTYYGIRNVGFSSGDSYTKLQLIQAMLVYSANDAEAVIAKRISGSNEAFAAELNKFAKTIGCSDTNVVSIYGFDEEGQFISTKDVATIFAHGMKNSAFADSVSLSALTLPATAKTGEKTFSTNVMMTYSSSPYYHSSVKGGKETETTQSGKCTAVVSSQDGYSYVTVIMNGKSEAGGNGTTINTANSDAKTLVSWVYKNLSIKTVAEAGAVIATLPVQGGKKSDKVQLTVKNTVASLVSNNVSSNSVLIELEDSAKNLRLVAPVKEGDEICKADIIYANETIATVDLIAASTVSLSTPRLLLQKFSNFMMSGVVIFIEVVLLIGLLCLLAYYVLRLLSANQVVSISAVKKGGRDVPASKQKNAPDAFERLRKRATELPNKLKEKFKK